MEIPCNSKVHTDPRSNWQMAQMGCNDANLLLAQVSTGHTGVVDVKTKHPNRTRISPLHARRLP